VAGALKAVDLHEVAGDRARTEAATWRALHVLQALREVSYPANHAATNAVLGRCAAAARSAEALEVADAAMAAAAAAHVPVFDRTYQTLMLAWERIGERTKCIDKMLEMKERGWSPDAQILLDLYQWCMEEGDQDSAAVVEKELVLSGKAQYLAALASPRC